MVAVLFLALAALLAGAGPASALPYVAIDAGHGDRDGGAVGPLPSGAQTGLTPRTDGRGRPVILEKDVNLDVALRLDAWLRSRGARTILTRRTDLAAGDRPYVSERADLRARTDIANEAGAEVFVSLHQNSLAGAGRGTETYHADLTSPASRALAEEVQHAVVERLQLHDRGVKTSGFFVLRGTRMPAILIEGAFLSDPSEAILMARPSTRQALAEAVGVGIERFAARGPLATLPRPRPRTIGPWRARPRSVPAGYRLVRVQPTGRLPRGGWLATLAV